MEFEKRINISLCEDWYFHRQFLKKVVKSNDLGFSQSLWFDLDILAIANNLFFMRRVEVFLGQYAD